MTIYAPTNAVGRTVDFRQQAYNAPIPLGTMVLYTTAVTNETLTFTAPSGAIGCIFSFPSGTRRFTIDGVTVPSIASNLGMSSGNGLTWQVKEGTPFSVQFANAGATFNLQWYGTA